MASQDSRTSRFIRSLANAELPDSRMTILYPIVLVVIAVMVTVSLFLGSHSAASQGNSHSGGGTVVTTVPSTTSPSSSSTTTPSGSSSTTSVENASGGGTTDVPTAALNVAETSVKSQFQGSVTPQVASSSANTIAFNLSGTDLAGNQVVVTVVVVNQNGQWEVATGG